MALLIILLVLGALDLCWFLFERVKEKSTKAAMIKSSVSVLFMSVAAVAWSLVPAGAAHAKFAPFLLIGLLCGLLGDIWLDLKFVYPKENDIYTFAGFYAFAAGHILFIIGLIWQYGAGVPILYIVLPLLIACAVGAGNLALAPVMKMEYGKFKAITGVYGAILFGMTLLAGSLALYYHFEFWTLNLMFIGGVFFAISDLILSGTYFSTGKDRPVDVITNHATYYIAQFIIAMSIYFIR